MTPSFIPWIQAQDSMLLIGLLFLYVLPLWLSYRLYRGEQERWRPWSILATVLMSWVGFLLVRCIRSGAGGYMEARRAGSAADRKS